MKCIRFRLHTYIFFSIKNPPKWMKRKTKRSLFSINAREKIKQDQYLVFVYAWIDECLTSRRAYSEIVFATSFVFTNWF